jgi:hypothetical protein
MSICGFIPVLRNVLLTIRYKSGFPRESFPMETLGAAIAGKSSPGIICLRVVIDAIRQRKEKYVDER